MARDADQNKKTQDPRVDTTMEQAILSELEMILATIKQINGNLEQAIRDLGEKRPGDYKRLVEENSARVREILAILNEAA